MPGVGPTGTRRTSGNEASIRAAQARANELQAQIDLMRQQQTEREQITGNLPSVQLERMGGAEEQAQRAQLAKELMAQQQAAQRQLSVQQARTGVRGGAAGAQQSRLAQQITAQQRGAEEQRFMAQQQFNREQAQKEQFANVATQLAQRQLMAALRGQDVGAQSAQRYGESQVRAAQSGGKVICAELGRQGYLDQKTLEADAAFGRMVWNTDRELMIGYWRLALPVVALMRASKVVTFVVSLIAKPWAKHMAYQMGVTTKDNALGRFVMMIGKPLCRLVARRVKVYG